MTYHYNTDCIGDVPLPYRLYWCRTITIQTVLVPYHYHTNCIGAVPLQYKLYWCHTITIQTVLVPYHYNKNCIGAIPLQYKLYWCHTIWSGSSLCLLTGMSIRNRMKMKKVHQTPLKLEMESSDGSTRQMWVNRVWCWVLAMGYDYGQ